MALLSLDVLLHDNRLENGTALISYMKKYEHQFTVRILENQTSWQRNTFFFASIIMDLLQRRQQ